MVAGNTLLVGSFLIMAIFLLISMANVKVVSTYRSTVVKKKKSNSMDSIFIPKTDYLLLMENKKKIETTSQLYHQVKIGDTVEITVYSNGVHRLDKYTQIIA